MGKSFEVLKSQAMEYATRLQSSPIHKEVALWSFLLYLLPKLTFPLVAMTLSETQCSQIQSPALRALLPKLHLNRNTSRNIIHGPLVYGGLNLPHLYTLQGIGQLKFLLGHLRAQDKMSKLILISHGYLQLVVGITENFLNVPYDVYHHWACPSWLTSVWQFASKLQLKITMVNAWLPPKPMDNDLNIMEYFISQKFLPKQLIRLNRCRLYLQLLSLSDMVSADGRRIMGSVLAGHKLMDRRSKLTWPEQGTPTTSDWLLWASAFQPLHSKTILLQPISMAAMSSHQSWFWYIDRYQSLYQLVDNSWVHYNPLPRQRHSPRINDHLYFRATSQPSSSPPLLLPAASVEEHPQGTLQVTPHATLILRSDTDRLETAQLIN
jgi:hypothetical protein